MRKNRFLSIQKKNQSIYVNKQLKFDWIKIFFYCVDQLLYNL